jgi:hypothetical protein
MPPDETVERIAQGLLRWGRGSRGWSAVENVYAWTRRRQDASDEREDRRTLAFAFAGPARNLWTAFGFNEHRRVSNHGNSIEYSLGKHLGFAVRMERFGSDPQFMTDGGLGPDELLSGIEDAVGYAISAGNSDSALPQIDVTLLPRPGRPWEGPGTRYYNAVSRIWQEPTKAPPWQAGEYEVEDGNVRVLRSTADWCVLSLRLRAPAGGHGWVRLGNMPCLVTHTFEINPGAPWEPTAQAILRCRGLLYPSLAIGPIPGANYGPCVLVANPYLVLSQITHRKWGVNRWGIPGSILYKAPSRPNVLLFSSDAWTWTTGEMSRGRGVELFRELAGQTDSGYWGDGTMVALGPPRRPANMAPEDVRLITDKRDLVDTIERRFTRWRNNLSFEEFVAVHAGIEAEETVDPDEYRRTGERYAYLEAKAFGIVPFAAFPAAVIPARGGEAYARFLEAAGFRGRLMPIELKRDEQAVYLSRRRKPRYDEQQKMRDSYVKYRYAWRVAALVERELAELQV